MQSALHRSAINEDAVAKKLEDLAERNMVREQDGCWCLDGFSGDIAKGAFEFLGDVWTPHLSYLLTCRI